MSSQTTYAPLSSHEFRVLRIARKDLRSNSWIQATLEVANLNGLPKYFAMSYTWQPAGHVGRDGRPSRRLIYLNGQVTPIQSNLYEGLEQMLPTILQAQLPIFIDALCINQSDDAEKSIQVGQMQIIYESAVRVWAWVGAPSSKVEAELAASMLKRCAEKAPTDGIDAFVPGHDNDNLRQWMAVMDIFDHEYWQRTWCQQEITGSAPTRFWYGTHRFTREMIFSTMRVARAVATGSWIEGPLLIRFGRSSAVGRLSSLTNRRLNSAMHGKPTLLRLCLLARSTRCSDPRDKIFALRGIATDLAPTVLMPDYSKPFAEICMNVAKFCLKQDNVRPPQPYILSHVAHPPSGPSGHTPSWVPDWNAPLDCQVGFLVGYNAMGAKLLPKPQVRHDTLLVWGRRVDTLAFRTYAASPADPRVFMKHMPAPGSAVYEPTMTDKLDVFLRTMVGDRRRKKDSHGKWKYIIGAKMDWSIYDILSAEYKSPDSVALRLSAEVVSANRVYGTTKEIGYMGMFPLASRLGDLIVVIAGGHNAHVLRQRAEAGRYTYIGECYVHGIMDGEAMKDPTNLEEFVLE